MVKKNKLILFNFFATDIPCPLGVYLYLVEEVATSYEDGATSYKELFYLLDRSFVHGLRKEEDMPRFILVVCLTTFVATTPLFAQPLEDVVYLKDGTIVRGTIIEQIPGESLKIQTQGGSMFFYTLEEIAKIVKEPVLEPEVKAEPDPEPDVTTDETAKIAKESVMELRKQIRVKKKEPWLAFALSLLMPGTGQFYNEQYKKGIPQLGAVIAGAGLVYIGVEDNYRKWDGPWVDPDDDNVRIAVPGGILWACAHLWSVIDAPLSAIRINKQSQQHDYGHLLEFDGDQATLGFDPVVSPDRSGARLTLHF